MLAFPFVCVTAPQKVFGGVPNLDELRSACPSEFKASNTCWSQAANAIFYTGWTDERQERAMELFIAEEAETMRGQVDYFNTVLGCYELPHNDKSAICGWLLSLMFRECPAW